MAGQQCDHDSLTVCSNSTFTSAGSLGHLFQYSRPFHRWLVRRGRAVEHRGHARSAIAITPPRAPAISSTTAGGPNSYYQAPTVYVADLGTDATYANAIDYQIDAWSYGGGTATVAVVESTYQIRYTATGGGGRDDSENHHAWQQNLDPRACDRGSRAALQPGVAQAIVSEDFTGTGTTNPWYYFNGACLTASTHAGTGTSGVTAGIPPGCTTLQSYYDSSTYTTTDSALVGGYHGEATTSTAWNSSTALDPTGYGALRFTNGCINNSSNGGGSGGHHENGLIISGNTYSTDQGLDITFKTVSYRGIPATTARAVRRAYR